MVIEVYQNIAPARTMVMIPGTHPRTLDAQTNVSLDNAILITIRKFMYPLTRETRIAP